MLSDCRYDPLLHQAVYEARYADTQKLHSAVSPPQPRQPVTPQPRRPVPRHRSATDLQGFDAPVATAKLELGDVLFGDDSSSDGEIPHNGMHVSVIFVKIGSAQ